MKIVSLLLTCLLYPNGDVFDKITGNWIVIKAESKDATFYPLYYRAYRFYFSKTFIDYNHDGNEKQAVQFSMNNDTLTLNPQHIGSTLVHCVGRENDSLERYVDYSGVYELRDSILVISNKAGKLYLRRSPIDSKPRNWNE